MALEYIVSLLKTEYNMDFGSKEKELLIGLIKIFKNKLINLK
jgi:hypothetical protein